MADSVKDVLTAAGVLQHVILPQEISLILAGLRVDSAEVAGEIQTGLVTLVTDLRKSPIPGFDFALTLPPVVKPAPYKLKLGPTSFQFWLLLADQGQATFVFKFVRGVPGLVPAVHFRHRAGADDPLVPVPKGMVAKG